MNLLSPKLLSHPTFNMLYWYCGCCERLHPVGLQKSGAPDGSGWAWNGDADKPTFSPSFGTDHGQHSELKGYCHVIITDGVVHYLPDTTVNAEYAGVQKPLLDIPQETLNGIMRNR